MRDVVDPWAHLGALLRACEMPDGEARTWGVTPAGEARPGGCLKLLQLGDYPGGEGLR